jgi:Uma2 family endonuclease
MAVAKKLITAEEFWLLPEHRYAELVDGEVVGRMPTGGLHGKTSSTVNALLWFWARQTGAEQDGQEAGFIVKRNPDQVRAPDVYFIRAERVAQTETPEGFWEIARFGGGSDFT